VARKKRREAEQAGFDDQPAGQPARLTPVDIQQKVFRLAFRGYNERDVDEFLDRVTEALAALHEENKRLREGGGGGSGGEDVEAARAQAESIVREAREHAARLMEDAGEPAGAGAGGGLTSAFLLRERDFLQRMAHSVQEHARWLKEEAQRQQTPSATVVASPKSGKAADAGKDAAKGAAKDTGRKAKASTAAKNATASVGEATAAWGPPQPGMTEPAGGWTSEPQSGEPDPLLSAWESAFTAEGPEDHSGKTVGKTGKEGEPSLKELFWGEE
jgi:DivIVA domain-containing protein